MKTKFKNCKWLRNIIRITLVAIQVSILGVTIVSCKGIVRGSGNIISEDRNVSGFSKVSISGIGNLYIEQGDEEGLTIEAEDNILPIIEAKVSGDTLNISFKTMAYGIPTESMEFHLRVKDLKSISASGSGSINCLGLNTDSLTIKTSGSRKVDMSNLKTTSIDINSSGSGNITLAGITDSQDIKLSGSKEYFAEELKSNSCIINASGSGAIVVNVSDNLNIKTSGSRKITYIGSPTITQKISGSVTISSK